MRRVRETHGTVDEVLARARLGPDQVVGATSLGRADGRGRKPLARRAGRTGPTTPGEPEPGASTIEVPGTLVTQILRVDRQRSSPRSRAVTLTARETSEALAVDVADEGSIAMESADVFDRGTSGGKGLGIGLALARSMAQASGGRLLLACKRAGDLHSCSFPAAPSRLAPLWRPPEPLAEAILSAWASTRPAVEEPARPVRDRLPTRSQPAAPAAARGRCRIRYP